MNPDSQSARYFALLYAAHAERPALEALFGIEREVLDSVRPGLDHHVSHSRLQWWREECERAARGGAAHPLTRALIAAVGDPQAKSVPQLAGLCGIVDVATWDLASATFGTRRELDAYCQRWASAMIQPLVAASTHTAPTHTASTQTAASALGPGDPVASAALLTSAAARSPTAHRSPTSEGADRTPSMPGASAALQTTSAAARSPTAHRSPTSEGADSTASTPAASAALQTSAAAQSPTAHRSPTSEDGDGTPSMPGASAALLASPERTAAWQDLGAAICEIELLAGLTLDAHQGRIRVPLDELESAKVDTNSLAKLPWPETAAALIRGRLTFLRNEIERSVAGSSREQQKALRGLLVWAALSSRTAQRMERALPNRPQLGRFAGFSDAWFAWRIARRATVGRFRLN